MNWLSVLVLFSTKCSDAESAVISDHWELLRKAYDVMLVEAVQTGQIDSRDCAVRAITFRSFLIQRLPDGPGQDRLYREAVAILREELPMPLERAREETADWRARPIAVIRDLRYVKQLVNPVDELIRSGVRLMDEPDLQPWRQLLPSLP